MKKMIIYSIKNNILKLTIKRLYIEGRDSI